MAYVRFLDQVSISSFSGPATTNSSGDGVSIPRIILPGETYTVSANTSVTAYDLIVLGTLLIEGGTLIPGTNPPLYTDGQLVVENSLDIQGTVINNGILEITFATV